MPGDLGNLTEDEARQGPVVLRPPGDTSITRGPQAPIPSQEMTDEGRRRSVPRAGQAKHPPALQDHRRQGKRFVPPLMQFDNLTQVSWYREMLPDFLWIALMMGRRSDWRAVYEALTVVDRFLPAGDRIADGRLSSFALVPEPNRAAARKALRHETPHALPTAFGHALRLFPKCPAVWLYADSPEHSEPDPTVGLPLLRSLIEDNADKSGVRSTRLRMAAISRMVTHGKFVHTGDSLMQMVPRYPSGLIEEDQRTVESLMRAMWGTLFGIEVEDDRSALDWAHEFWQRSRSLVPCEVKANESTVPVSEVSDGPLDPEPMIQLSELRALLSAARALGAKLRAAQLAAFAAPADDHTAAVLFGMASRMYRLVLDFLDRPSSWAPATASFYLRPLVETRIVSAWLGKKDDPLLIEAYREHGLGNLKLLREHIKADFGEDADGDAREFLASLDHRVNLELEDWAQPVNVGAFSDTTIRKMAIECDLKRVYDLTFAPMSSENHGEWPSVRDNDTTVCSEPLHGRHRVGSFVGSPHTIGPQAIASALKIAEDGIVDIFAIYGIDVAGEFAPVWEAFDAAMYADQDETAG